MNIELNHLVEIVDELNNVLPETSEHWFTVSYASYWMSVSFGEFHLWDSENDNREFNEDLNDYEPLLDYIKKQLNNKIEELDYSNKHIQ